MTRHGEQRSTADFLFIILGYTEISDLFARITTRESR